jgi:hypothetical protein
MTQADDELNELEVAGWWMATGDPPPQQYPRLGRGGLLLQAGIRNVKMWEGHSKAQRWDKR